MDDDEQFEVGVTYLTDLGDEAKCLSVDFRSGATTGPGCVFQVVDRKRERLLVTDQGGTHATTGEMVTLQHAVSRSDTRIPWALIFSAYGNVQSLFFENGSWFVRVEHFSDPIELPAHLASRIHAGRVHDWRPPPGVPKDIEAELAKAKAEVERLQDLLIDLAGASRCEGCRATIMPEDEQYVWHDGVVTCGKCGGPDGKDA